MCERDDQGYHFTNPSIELLQQSLRGYVDAKGCLPYDKLSEENLCVCMMQLFVMMDDFPFNLPYNADVPAIKAGLSPVSVQKLVDFHVLVESKVRDRGSLCAKFEPRLYSAPHPHLGNRSPQCLERAQAQETVIVRSQRTHSASLFAA